MSKFIFKKEACVETLDQCLAAAENGAYQIELCARLDLGGTSPSESLVTDVLDHLSIPIKVMVRPRGGDFVYSEKELQQMLDTLRMYKDVGVTHVVSGMLTPENEIDFSQLNQFSEVARQANMHITFHKAIDDSPDILKSMEALVASNMVDAVLTSGGHHTAWEGREVLKQMLLICGDKMTLVAAGRITATNIFELDQYLHAREYHGRKIVSFIR